MEYDEWTALLYKRNPFYGCLTLKMARFRLAELMKNFKFEKVEM